MKKTFIPIILCVALVFGGCSHKGPEMTEGISLEEVANGDAMFWLYQGPPNNRFMTCNVYYEFDKPLDADILLSRLKNLVSSYKMFRRNVVEVDGIPFWQDATPDWNKNFLILRNGEDVEAWRKQCEAEISTPSPPGKGIPLFRAYLTPDHRQFIFTWHHIISDYEGMFNKHAKHLFMKENERTKYGYQMPQNATKDTVDGSSIKFVASSLVSLFRNLMYTDRPLGFVKTEYNVQKIILPIDDQTLSGLGKKAGLPMSDIFSFIALRSITRYHEMKGEPGSRIKPVSTPLSLRKSSLDIDEGNNRAVKSFPLVFPLESVQNMHRRVLRLSPASSSYDRAGKFLKIIRKWPSIEPTIRKLVMPDYISNYFPLSDMSLRIAQATVISHHLRVCMLCYERTKFAWSSYNGEVQLYLHTDPLVIDEELMARSFKETLPEVLDFLRQM